MRILHVSKFAYPEPGGIETFVRDLSTEQIRQGHDVAVLAYHASSGAPTRTDISDGVEITRCRSFGTLGFVPLSPSSPVHLRRLIKRLRPQVIHLHVPNPAVLLCPVLPRDIPLVIHWHADVEGSPSPFIKYLYPLYHIFEKACLDKAKAIIATTDSYLAASDTLKPWRSKCTVIPLGLDQERYPTQGLPASYPPLVLGVGRFAYYKGYEYLVNAAPLVPDAHFVLCGNGPEYTAIRRLVGELGLSDRIDLPGRVSDTRLRTLMEEATVFCLPSVDRGEAFGVVLLEAMHYELPLVSTSIPGSGTGWVNQDGATGHVVPPHAPEALASAIRDILESPERATRFGIAARQRLENHFTISRVTAAIQSLYDKLSD